MDFRNLRTDIDGLEELSHYWSVVRPYYADFESDIKSPNTEIYQHEMPGGQYSNLSQQAKSLGLGERFDEVKEMYRRQLPVWRSCKSNTIFKGSWRYGTICKMILMKIRSSMMVIN